MVGESEGNGRFHHCPSRCRVAIRLNRVGWYPRFPLIRVSIIPVVRRFAFSTLWATLPCTPRSPPNWTKSRTFKLRFVLAL